MKKTLKETYESLGCLIYEIGHDVPRPVVAKLLEAYDEARRELVKQGQAKPQGDDYVALGMDTLEEVNGSFRWVHRKKATSKGLVDVRPYYYTEFGKRIFLDQ